MKLNVLIFLGLFTLGISWYSENAAADRFYHGGINGGDRYVKETGDDLTGPFGCGDTAYIYASGWSENSCSDVIWGVDESIFDRRGEFIKACDKGTGGKGMLHTLMDGYAPAKGECNTSGINLWRLKTYRYVRDQVLLCDCTWLRKRRLRAQVSDMSVDDEFVGTDGDLENGEPVEDPFIAE